MSRRCVSSSCLRTSGSARPCFCSVICALNASMPPYWLYRGGLPPARMSGRYFSASSSHVVTCARISFTDQLPMTPGAVSCESDKPAYDSLSAIHAFSRCFRSCCVSMVQVLPPSDPDRAEGVAVLFCACAFMNEPLFPGAHVCVRHPTDSLTTCHPVSPRDDTGSLRPGCLPHTPQRPL